MNEFDLSIRTGLKAGELTVYGADWCSWTQKQRQYLDGKGMPYTYVNCEEAQCPSFVSGFPTLDNNGDISSGYQEI
ncbi:MAG: hypothetical protein R3E79_51225 [Caldilineaceae bacterium]